ncbi:MAG: hypothetical protein R2860_17415 [Desulfobacterales bacterium]
MLEMVTAFEKACGKKVPYKIVSRRSGDIGTCYADPSLAEKIIMESPLGNRRHVRGCWRWQSANPKGYS